MIYTTLKGCCPNCLYRFRSDDEEPCSECCHRSKDNFQLETSDDDNSNKFVITYTFKSAYGADRTGSIFVLTQKEADEVIKKIKQAEHAGYKLKGVKRPS